MSLKSFFIEEDGATAIEYGLIAGLIAVGIIVATTNVGTELASKFQSVADSLSGEGGDAPAAD